MRPFRVRAPDVEGSLLRSALQRRLLERFDLRVMVMRAGAGFGKTTSLAQAADQNRLLQRGIDRWLTCESGDKDAEHFLSALGHSLGREATTVADVVAFVASCSPAQVCLILDDVHEIPSGSGGAAVMGRLLDELPANGHVLLATRHDPPVLLARLDAQAQVGWVGPDDLRLDESEVAALALEAGIAVENLQRFGGWPALVALAARTQDVTDFLHQEVMAWLTNEQRSALEASVALGPVDSRLLLHLAGVGPAVLGDLPLIHKVDGWFVPHDLWNEAVSSLVPAERLNELRRAGIEYLLAEGDGTRAMEACLGADEPELFGRAVREVILQPQGHDVSDVRRWLASMPRTEKRSPASDYLVGLVAQHEDPTSQHTYECFSRAADGFRGAGDFEAEVAALVQVGYWHHLQRDVDGLFSVASRTVELASQGVESAAPYAAISEAFLALLRGDPRGVLNSVRRVRSEEVTPAFAAMVDWLRAQALELSGYPSIEQADSCVTHGVRTAGFAVLAYSSRWRNGDIEAIIRGWRWRSEPESPRDEFLRNIWLGITAAAFGDVAQAQRHLDAAHRLAGTAEQVDISLGLLEAAIAGETGDMDTRREIAANLIERCPPRDSNRISYSGAAGMITREFPEWIPYFSSPVAGPLRRRDIEVAAALRRLDQGSLDGVAAMTWPEQHGGLISAALLSGAAELVCAAWAADRAEARDAAAWMARVIGEPARAVFRELTGHHMPGVASAARQIVAGIAVPPRHRVDVSVLGPVTITFDGQPVTDSNWRRERVRSLLGFLTLRRKATRDVTMTALWPDADEPAARRNLRSTLNLLHGVLEPERTAGEAPYFVRSDGRSLELCVGDHLSIDSWRFEGLLDQAQHLDTEGVPEMALVHLGTACDLYRGDFLADAAYDDWSAVERDRLRSRFVRGSVRLAEFLLAYDRVEEALVVAGRTLDAEPWSEAAHRAVIAAHLERGDRPAARRALKRCHEALDEVGGPVEELTFMLQRRLGWA